MAMVQEKASGWYRHESDTVLIIYYLLLKKCEYSFLDGFFYLKVIAVSLLSKMLSLFATELNLGNFHFIFVNEYQKKEKSR